MSSCLSTDVVFPNKTNVNTQVISDPNSCQTGVTNYMTLIYYLAVR